MIRFLSVILLLSAAALAQAPPAYRLLENLDYVGAGNPRQMLNLVLPEAAAAKPRPLVVFVHGGGWENGSKENPGMLFALLQGGAYVGASLNYRLSAEAIWPSQIHDVKAAIRWLRAHAAEYGLDPERIAVFGISAGGHLVSMLGVSNGIAALEGNLGAHLDQSSRVSCVIDFCGPSDFLTFGGKGSIIDPDDPAQVIAHLLGGPAKDQPEAARSASPVTYISKDDAPFLIVHGDQDQLVPLAQATEFDGALGAAGVSSTLITGTGGPHVFGTATLLRLMRDFLDRHLSGKSVEIPEAAIPVPE